MFPAVFIPANREWAWLLPNGRQGLIDELYGELVANSATICGSEGRGPTQ